MTKKKISWSRQLRINQIRREKYHLKKYGNLKKLEAKDKKLQDLMDEYSFKDEMKECDD